MNGFRVTLPEYADAATAVNGIGAAVGGGRWNYRGARCVYCGEDNTVALAEAGYYHMILPMLEFRERGLKRNIDEYHGRKLKLLGLHLPFRLQDIPSLVRESQFQIMAAKHGVELTFERSLMSEFHLIEGRATAQLAHLIISDRDKPCAIVTQSARSSGRCIATFPDCLKQGQKIRKVDEHDVRFWFASGADAWDGKDADKIKCLCLWLRLV